MARAGDPRVNELEDLLLACTLRIGRAGFDFPLPQEMQASLQAMLREFPDEDVKIFIKTTSEFLGVYVGMAALAEKRKARRPNGGQGQRSGLRGRARRLARAADELVSAIFDMELAEFDLIAHIAKKGIKPTALYKHLLNDELPDASDVEKTAFSLSKLGGVAEGVAMLLEGTAQDRSRPLRFLVTTLHRLWLALEWTEPVWRGDNDSADVEQDDGDLFCEVVRFLLEGFSPDSPVDIPERILALRPEPGQINYILRQVISPRDRSSKNSRDRAEFAHVTARRP
jgi:hypothetical protein